MIEVSTVILAVMRTALVALSPFAANIVANGGSSALFAAISTVPAVFKVHLVDPGRASGGDRLFDDWIRGVPDGLKIHHLEGAVAIAGI